MKNKERALSLSMLIVLIISCFAVVTSTVLGTILTVVSVSKMKDMVSKKTLELANTAAAMLDGDSLKGLKAEDKDTPAYQNAYKTLEQFKISNQGTSGELAYIYACRSIGNNQFEFTIDPSDDPATFGEPLEWTKALDSANKGIPLFDEAPYTDRWGTFYSAYSPVFDSNHDVVMIVGIDVWADWYNDMVWSNSRSIIIVSAVSAISGILVGVLLNVRIRKRFETLSKEYSELEDDVQTLISEIKEPIDFAEHDEDNTPASGDQLIQLREKIQATQKEIKEYIIYTQKQAYVDALAHVGNRAAYLERIKTLDFSCPFALVILDINGLKYINDNYGHENGDKTIEAVSEILQSIFDQNDIYRIGGDEFVVLCVNGDEKDVYDAYNLIDGRFFNYNNRNKLPFPIYVSKGIAFFDKNSDKSLSDVFNRADEDMYRSKEEFYNKNPKMKKRYRQ